MLSAEGCMVYNSRELTTNSVPTAHSPRLYNTLKSSSTMGVCKQRKMKCKNWQTLWKTGSCTKKRFLQWVFHSRQMPGYVCSWFKCCSNIAYSIHFHGNCVFQIWGSHKVPHIQLLDSGWCSSMKLHQKEVLSANTNSVVTDCITFKWTDMDCTETVLIGSDQWYNLMKYVSSIRWESFLRQCYAFSDWSDSIGIVWISVKHLHYVLLWSHPLRN